MTQTPTIGFFRMLPLECKKLKRTGCLPAVVLCGLFAAAFPLANMLVRPEAFTTLPGDPLSILADANWQMIAMLNILLSVCLSCIMYHTEFADRGIQKSETLPVKAHLLFLGKGTILAVSGIVVILTECAARLLCAPLVSGLYIRQLRCLCSFKIRRLSVGHADPHNAADALHRIHLLKYVDVAWNWHHPDFYHICVSTGESAAWSASVLHALSSAVRICLGRRCFIRQPAPRKRFCSPCAAPFIHRSGGIIHELFFFDPNRTSKNQTLQDPAASGHSGLYDVDPEYPQCRWDLRHTGNPDHTGI